MSWTIRNDTSDELYHYGVKGMKWGVRKEYEPKGRSRSTKTKSNSELVDLNNPDTWGSNPGKPSDKPVSDYVNASKTYVNFLSKIEESEAFREYVVKQKTSDGILRLIDDYSNAVNKVADSSLSIDQREVWKNEAIRFGKQMDKMLTDFSQTHMNDMTEAELAAEQQWAQMVDNLSDEEFSEVLADGSTIKMERWWDGEKYIPKYVFTGRDGKVEVFDFGEEDALKEYASKEKSQKVDFRKTQAGKRTREKNVDPNAKPVSIKKGQKVEVGEKERTQKKFSSPAAAKTRDEILDMSKNKGTYGLDAIKRNKTMMEANLQRGNKSLTKIKLKPATKLSSIDKAKGTITSGAKAVKDQAKKTVGSIGNFVSSGKKWVADLFKKK